MSNSFIDAQVKNMEVMSKTFVQSCRMAATKDDGVVSREEAKTLKRIEEAVERFVKDLNKAIRD